MPGRSARPSRVPFTVALALAGLTLASCEGRDSGQAPAGTTDTPRPTAAAMSDPSAAPSWRLGPAGLRIDADPAEPLRFIEAAVEGPDGRIHTLHARETAVRSWTPDGQPAGTWGGGAGGEAGLPDPRTLGRFGDTLWVMDGQTHRVRLFGADGRLLGALEPAPGGDPAGSQPWALPPRPRRPLRDGSFLGVEPEVSEAVARGDQRRTAYVRMDAAGAMLDTVWLRSWRPEDVLLLPGTDVGAYAPQPFADSPLVGVSADGVLAVVDRRVEPAEDPPSFQVTWISPAGDTLARSAVPYEPTAPGQARIDSAVAELAERWSVLLLDGGDPVPVDDLRRSISETLNVPDHLPPVTDLVVAADGSVWLRRPAAGEGGTATGVEWWVLAPDGGVRARVSAPAELRILHAGPDHVLGTVPGPAGGAALVRHPVLR